MTERQWDVILVGLPVMLGVFLSLVGVLLNLSNRSKINAIHLEVNSRMTELLNLSRASAHAEGVKQEKERGQR